MGMIRKQLEQNKKMFAWFRVSLLIVSWIVLFSSVAYADDCLRDITRAED